MRTSLACHVSLRHFGVWRAAVGLLALLSISVLLAWAVSGRELWSAAAMAAAALAAMAVILLAASVARIEPATLQLHEGGWTFTHDRLNGAGSSHGSVDVAIDLGSFMLLAFRPELPSGRRGARRWLPAQRRGHEHDWHALRCAVYSPRFVSAGPGARSPQAPP
jgi:hypothetical protein